MRSARGARLRARGRATAALAALILGACSPNVQMVYPEEVRTNFLRACEAAEGSTPEGCECVLDELEATVPLDEFVELDREATQSGAPLKDERVKAALDACTE